MPPPPRPVQVPDLGQVVVDHVGHAMGIQQIGHGFQIGQGIGQVAGAYFLGRRQIDDVTGHRNRQPVTGIGQTAHHTISRTQVRRIGHRLGKDPADKNTRRE